MQLSHYQTPFKKRMFPVTIVCDQITSPANVGSIFRAADAFGAEKIVFCGHVLPDFGRRMQKTSRSAEKYVPFEIHTEIMPVLERLVANGYLIYALEITEDSVPLNQVALAGTEKVVLVIGGENLGIEEEELTKAHVITHIDMYGTNSSMNVAQALSLALYQFTNYYVSQG